MRAIFGLVLIVGLGLAGFAVYSVKGYLDQQARAVAHLRAIAAQRLPTVDVYAVTRPIGFGEALTADDVALIPYVEAHLPEGVFRSEEELFPEGLDVLRMVVREMAPNEPLLAAKVTAPGADAGITTRLSPGSRAFAISVDVASGVSGFLRPGDRVDVYWTGVVSGSGNGRQVTKLIETGLRLVAVDQTADAGRAQVSVARTVTVEVSPQQVASLALAQASGKLALSLVGNADESVAMAEEVDQRALLGIVEEVQPVEIAPPPPAAEVCTIRTRRGSEVVEIPVPCRE